MHLQIGDCLLHLEGVLCELLLHLLRLHAHLEDLVNDLLKVLNQVVVLKFDILVRFVDNVDKDLTVVLQRSPERFEIVVNLNK